MGKRRDNTEGSGAWRLEPTPIDPYRDGDETSARRSDEEGTPDPTTPYGLAWRAARAWGFQSVMVLLMAAFIWFLITGYRESTAVTHGAFQAVMKEQTDALKDMATEQRQTNRELIQLGAKLDKHLDDGPARRREGR